MVTDPGKGATPGADPSPEGAHGDAGGGRPAARKPRRPEMVTVWPHLLFRETLAGLACIIVLAVVSILFDAPLEDPADPTRTPNPAKAPWYLVGLQELLTYFDPWMAGVGIPLIIVFGLCAIPYIDPTTRGQGVYTLRRRPMASAIFLLGVAGWFVLIAIGLWFRGPGWAWVWPWAARAGPPPVPVMRSLPNPVGIPLVLAYFVGGGALIVRWTRNWSGFTLGRRRLFAFLVLSMGGTVIKILLKLVFDVQYVVRFERFGFNL